MPTFDSVNKHLQSEPIPEFTVTSLGEFCSLVEYITAIWRKTVADRQLRLDQPAPFNYGELSPWFRGLSNSDYACEPSLFRFHKKLREFQGVEKPTIDEMEEYFFQRFKAFGPPLLESSAPKSKLEWNFLMRNHGVPSRLLDWSKGSFIGLYFATRKSFLKLEGSQSKIEDSQVKKSSVWMLEPRRLNEISGHMRDLFRGSYEKFSEEYFPELADIRNVNKLYPLPLIPNLISSRIRAHIGRFTLHSFREGGLRNFANEAFRLDAEHDNQVAYLVKIIIPVEYHFKICRSLRSTGISDMNFTQDLDGLINELKLRVILGREDHNNFAREQENSVERDRVSAHIGSP